MLAATVVGLTLAGCGAGRNNEQDKERATPYVGVADAGTMAVRGARLVPATAGTSATSATAQGYLLVSLVNRGTQPDSLSDVTVSGGLVQPVGADASSLVVQPNEAASFGNPDLGGTGPALAISGLTQPPQLGTTMNVTLQFQTAGSVTLAVPVVSPDIAGTTATAAPILTTGSYPGVTSP